MLFCVTVIVDDRIDVKATMEERKKENQTNDYYYYDDNNKVHHYDQVINLI